MVMKKNFLVKKCNFLGQEIKIHGQEILVSWSRNINRWSCFLEFNMVNEESGEEKFEKWLGAIQ